MEKLIHKKTGLVIIHLQSPHIDDYSLCGCDLAGDIYYDNSIKTNQKYNCKTCIEIVEFCKKIKLTSFDSYTITPNIWSNGD